MRYLFFIVLISLSIASYGQNIAITGMSSTMNQNTKCYTFNFEVICDLPSCTLKIDWDNTIIVKAVKGSLNNTPVVRNVSVSNICFDRKCATFTPNVACSLYNPVAGMFITEGCTVTIEGLTNCGW